MFLKQSDLTPEANSGHKKPNYLSQEFKFNLVVTTTLSFRTTFGSNDPSLRYEKIPLMWEGWMK